jgi:hypothetical protein
MSTNIEQCIIASRQFIDNVLNKYNIFALHQMDEYIFDANQDIEVLIYNAITTYLYYLEQEGVVVQEEDFVFRKLSKKEINTELQYIIKYS